MSKANRANRKKRFQEEQEEPNTRKFFRGRPKGIVLQAQTDGQKHYINTIHNNDITFCMGPAGCGKTIIATGLALQGIVTENPIYERLVIMRPAKEACEENIGALPGDIGEKMSAWTAPVVDNMKVFLDSGAIKSLFYNEKIEVLPLAFARGRSLNNAFIIVDEAQNVSPKQMMMILTRIGQGSKMVINGDLAQSDINGVNGLYDAFERLDGVKGIAFVELDGDDIVRSPIIKEIVKRYEDVGTAVKRKASVAAPISRVEPHEHDRDEDDQEYDNSGPLMASLETLADPKKLKGQPRKRPE